MQAGDLFNKFLILTLSYLFIVLQPHLKQSYYKMSDNEGKARDLIAEAEKKLTAKPMFGRKNTIVHFLPVFGCLLFRGFCLLLIPWPWDRLIFSNQDFSAKGVCVG